MAVMTETMVTKKFNVIEVNTPYENDNQILGLDTSNNLLPYTNDDLSDMGHHTTETLVPSSILQ